MNRFKESRSLKIGLIVIIIVFGSFGIIRSCFGATRRIQYPANQSETMSFSSGDSLKIETVSDNIVLRTSPGVSKVSAEVSGTGKIDCILKVIRSGSTVEISLRYPRKSFFFTFPLYTISSNDVTLIITVPEGTQVSDLSMKTVSGDIDIKSDISVQDELGIKTTSGDVTFGRLDASSVKLNSLSGNMKGDGISARKLTVETISSTIHVKENKAEDYELSTVSGDITLRSVSPRFSALEAQSTSGNITVAFTEEPSMKAKLSSISGTLILQESHGSRNLNISYGKAESNLEIHTTSGDISVTW
ncbi:DUF4097 family beta strand repeat-containing protein [Parasphaerochaeta coccoides]|uniref:DUF4097 domain-containing protein n=1 Tax=Parasphaerochaeta coccoides (strain ATCC BAA-1237 / DSM 17374 / SPN1) TaxID=760011 RepID=F4GJV0_PARC1|nr:DUF4097 family beta strand repeat-containing protein [Parasphaerochaeta coccoides]AEC01375.1 hypothetical protein Spico_0137 [Parasphaerochaeta coccoides DSM 17374]